MKKMILAAILPLLVAAGCSGPWAAVTPRESTAAPSPSPVPTVPATFMILGSVDVGEYYGVEGVEDGDSCITHGGFTDIEAGAQVTVLSADGTKLAVGDLQTGFIADSTCRFAFEVDGIPEGESLYDITVGREARGSVTYAREKLNETVRLVL